MKDSEFYENSSLGGVCSVDFSSFIGTQANPFPGNVVYDFMTLGPFIEKTHGTFETEYFYEREKILATDYLASSGGERSAVPYLGRQVSNDYWGKEYLEWSLGRRKWGQLRFEREHEGANCAALFVTDQRNCVFYAAVYVDCDRDDRAVICYEDSGSLLFLNGELVASHPYGRVKGISSVGNSVAVKFHKGRNLLLFKVRVGYIADTLDLCISHCSIYPIVAGGGALGLSEPKATSVYFGTEDAPRQAYQAFVGAFEDSPGAALEYASGDWSEKIEIPAMRRRECTLVRVSVPTQAQAGTAKVDASLGGGRGEFILPTLPWRGYEVAEHVCADFHFDTTYHQEQRTYAMGALHITKGILDELERDKSFKAVLSEVDYLHPYYSIYPSYRKLIRDSFAGGRAEADCFYNQPNDLTSSAEGFTRNLIYGQLYHRDVMGGGLTPTYSPGDVFGHPNQLSQICAKGGCKALSWGKCIVGTDEVMRHVSPDGTSLIHDKGLGAAGAQRLGLRNSGASGKVLDQIPTYPVDGGVEWMRDTLNHAKYSVTSELTGGIVKDEKKQIAETGYSKIEYTSRDITMHHAGVLLTRTDFKQANRLAENTLVSAEKFASIASFYGAEYPEKALDKAWRQLLCAQHHDSITGTNNEISFVDLMIEYRESISLASDILNRAAAYLASGVRTADGGMAYFVFNPREWERRDVCEVDIPVEFADGCAFFDSDGREYRTTIAGAGSKENTLRAVFAPRVPATGYAVYYLRKSSPAAPVSDAKKTIENEFFRVTVDEKLGGGIVSVYDKKAKKEVVKIGENGPANRVVVLREVPDRMETQHELYTTGHKLCSDEFIAAVTRETGAAFERLLIEVKLDTVAKVRQEIRLSRGVPRIDMKTVVEDYQSRDDLFTLTFPVDVRGAGVVYDDRFAPHVTSKSQKKLSFQTHQFLNYSHSRVAPVNQWIDLGPTVGLTPSKNGTVNIGMTAVIRRDEPEISKLCNILTDALTKKAIPVSPHSDREQRGGHRYLTFNEDLDSTDTRFVISLAGDGNLYAQKLLDDVKPVVRNRFEAALARRGTAMLFTRDADNAYKKPIDVVLIVAADADALRAALEDISSQLAAGHTLSLPECVCACRTEAAENYGVALFNRGTISCSVEPGNMLNMMLFHTADFYGNSGKVTGGAELVPEQKTHCFTYALCPHEGSYREADIYRRAAEFNDTLFAVTDIVNRADVLPQKQGFLSCSGNFLLTAFKAGGFPIASMKKRLGTPEERGFALRGFETDGNAHAAKFKLSLPITSVKSANLLEEDAADIPHRADSFTTSVGSHSIETYLIGAKKPEKGIGEQVIGAQHEAVSPVYVRSWEYDLGSMPMGYMAVAGTIDRKVERISDTVCCVNVSAVNNHTDDAVSLTLKLSTAGGLTLDRDTFDCEIEPAGFISFPVTVSRPSPGARGMVYLNYEYDGQEFEDILEFGAFEPRVTLKIDGETIVAEVINDTEEELHGSLSVASPFETWGEGAEALGRISPDVFAVDVKPGERKKYVFEAKFVPGSQFNAWWAAVKLMVNGRIFFAFNRVKGQRHNYWTHEFYGETLRSHGGSLIELLEM